MRVAYHLHHVRRAGLAVYLSQRYELSQSIVLVQDNLLLLARYTAGPCKTIRVPSAAPLPEQIYLSLHRYHLSLRQRIMAVWRDCCKRTRNRETPDTAITCAFPGERNSRAWKAREFAPRVLYITTSTDMDCLLSSMRQHPNNRTRLIQRARA